MGRAVEFLSGGTRAPRNGRPLSLAQVVAIADELQRRWASVAAVQQPAQVGRGLMQSRPGLRGEELRIIRMGTAVLAFVGHELVPPFGPTNRLAPLALLSWLTAKELTGLELPPGPAC